MSKSRNKYVGITLGDPSGIGPEIISKALSKHSIRKLCHYIIIGDQCIYDRYGPPQFKNCTFFDVNSFSDEEPPKPGRPNHKGAQASLNYLKTAIALFKKREIDALVTAPVSKEGISEIDSHFIGHTEHIAKAFHKKNAGMMFVSDKLRTILVTRHIPLRRVSRSITSKLVYETIIMAHHSLVRQFKIKRPRLAVCGLNPHAGEGGLFGNEEIKIINPAIEKAQKHRIRVEGPYGADMLFSKTIRRSFDIIVAMYHDQGLIPVKSMNLDTLVNLTIGLPIVRTSPAHGTAFDIAGKNMADPASMDKAIRLAVQLSR